MISDFLEQHGKSPNSILLEFEKHGLGSAYPKQPTKLEDFNLSTRAYSALKAYFSERNKKGETDLHILSELTYEKLIKMRYVGKRTAAEIMETKEYILGK